MGQFKPMVKMMTTEPTVELKLAKGGIVSMKKGGSTTKAKKMAMGGDPMMSGEPGMASEMMGAPRMPSGPVGGSAAPVVGPKRPPMSMRRKAMKPPMRPPMRPPMSAPAPMASPAPMAPPSAPMMKKGGNADMMQDKAMMKKAFKQHDMQEHKGGKGTTLKLKNGGMKYATGGVVNNQGGYKKGGLASGGIINTENQGGEYRNTKMHTSKTDHSPAKTGGVKNGNGGGYKTGGVTKSNAGGYMNGGATKKFADGGSVQSDGRPVKMAQGAKKPSSPVSINQLSGTFKKGGKVTTAKKMADGGDAQARTNAAARDAFDADERKFNEGLRSDVGDALMYIPRKIKKALSGMTGQGAVTTTEREVSKTVSPPGRKRGGSAC